MIHSHSTTQQQNIIRSCPTDLVKGDRGPRHILS